MFIDCEQCHGKGRIKEHDFDGYTMTTCHACTGAGEIELTAEETAILERFLENVRVALTCDACGMARDLHDDGECPPIGLIVSFPTWDAPRPAA
jgi:RecJ-like exonuclease